jgi:hypothetical protein
MIDSEPQIAVDLWAARIPGFACIAEHHWLIVARPGTANRWEVWQTPGESEVSWGHLHCDLLRLTSGVGNGPGRMLHRWTGTDACELAQRIEEAPSNYPWIDTYRVFPGPNSNTFVQWALAGIYKLGWRGIGRAYVRHCPVHSRE